MLGAATTVSWKVFDTLALLVSVAVTVTDTGPTAEVVPLIVPAVDIVNPAGRPVALHVNGGTPLVAVRVSVYLPPDEALGSDVAAMLGGGCTDSVTVPRS